MERRLHRFIVSFLFVVFTCNIFSNCFAQNEYLATLDYNTASVQRIGNSVPGVTWVNDRSAYDKNHQRFFFQGGAVNGPPWSLFTINAVAGDVIYSVSFSSSIGSGTVAGLQYDNSSNTLYGLFFANFLTYFTSIDPATGTVSIINSIPPFNGFCQATFDERDHTYIMANGSTLLGLDANTGTIKNNLVGLTINNPVYDNRTNRLYGIKISPILQSPQFDSIGLSAGTLFRIADLPQLSLPQVSAYTIDEQSNKYIFVGTDDDGTACVNDFLYVLDVSNGAILERTTYPYAKAKGSANSTYENVIDFSFDNSRQRLYALNWYPPDKPARPIITATASANPACAGSSVNFTASSDVSLDHADFQWFVNGLARGNATTFTTSDLVDGDIVQAILDCVVPTDSSNAIVMRIAAGSPAISISASAGDFCSGDTIVFSATTTGTGSGNSYQWQLNGENIGTGADTLMRSGLNSGDLIHCIMNTIQPCMTSIVSNDINISTKPSPQIFIGSDTVVLPGASFQFNPSITGNILSYEWSPATYLNDASIPNPVFTAGTTTDYVLSVSADNGCKADAKISVAVYRELRMPNSFTPNGDGRNDVFRIPSSTPQKIKSFAIFNRFGEMIFHSTNSGAVWDGTFNNQQQQTGTYVWVIEYEDPFTKKNVVGKGTVVLVR